MTRERPFQWVCAVLLLFGLAGPAWSQEAGRATRGGSWFVTNLSDQDVIVAVTSVQWGAPDRWSFTSRYIHMFNKDRDYRRVLHNFSVTLSPGTAGGRLGAGYENIFNTKQHRPGQRGGVTLLSEARVVCLRTWGHPLSTDANRNFVGGEVRTSLAGVVNVGVGYYAPISAADGRPTAFWGLHAGVGM